MLRDRLRGNNTCIHSHRYEREVAVLSPLWRCRSLEVLWKCSNYVRCKVNRLLSFSLSSHLGPLASTLK